MEFVQTNLKDAYIIKPQVFGDERGFFMETFSTSKFVQAGIDFQVMQSNHSKSAKNVLRGLHFQLPEKTQAKLVRVIAGAVYDVILDLRKGSFTYGQWEGFELSAENKKMLFVPKGFAHGFCTLEDNTEFEYHCDDLYAKDLEGGILWNDFDLKINWPVNNPTLSDKDKVWPRLKEFNSPFKI